MAKVFAALLCTAVAQEDLLQRDAGSSPSEAVITLYKRQELAPLTLTGPLFDRVVKDNPTEWVVFSCVSWLDECQELQEEFRALGRELESKLNGDLFPSVRFAEVDCARDKVLCNQEHATRSGVNGRRASAYMLPSPSP
ncbi:unnamed protein product [Effrenium voratum]|nr:unnamed protein product [Effrenium voratum]